MNAMLPLAPIVGPCDRAADVVAAAKAFAPHLAKGKPLARQMVSQTMSLLFGGTDAEGAWQWRDAYDAMEAAQVLQIRRLGPQVGRVEDAPGEVAAMLSGLTDLTMTHTRRSEEQVALDQFSTPPSLAALCVAAAQVRPGDVVCEPSAGTGIIAAVAEACGAALHLNEVCPHRSGILAKLFPTATLTQLDAAYLHDRSKASGAINAVVCNPPFGALERHLRSALKLLADGGRLVAIVPRPALENAGLLASLGGKVVARIAFPANAFAKHGTSVETGLLVVDRLAPDEALPALIECGDLAAVALAVRELPGRAQAQPRTFREVNAASLLPPRLRTVAASAKADYLASARAVAYEVIDWTGEGHDVGLFQAHRLGRIRLAKSAPHPSMLVESGAMASVAPPAPSYRPSLPAGVLDMGVLSDPQMEAVIYAGEAHSQFLPGHWTLHPETHDLVPAQAGEGGAFQVRAGFFVGDGTGVGKGQVAAACITDGMCQGRRRHVWLSLNEPLIEDARRDIKALGGSPDSVVSLGAFKLGDRITLREGVLFATYATLRQQGVGEKASRLDQLVEALGADFDGCLIFDEGHHLANAAGDNDEGRGGRAPSLQGLAGLALQNRLPNARVVYLSATGFTRPQHLAYAVRLGLWGGPDAPFNTRDDFLTSIEAGGLPALELVARELKAMGRYIARSLSFEGVEYEPLVHQLSDADVTIWDQWADAFQIIYRNLNQALEATGAVKPELTGRAAAAAKSAALSAFQSTSLRFFSHLLGGLKAPTLIDEIRTEVLPAGKSAVIQIVSTNEAVLNRRISQVSPEEWSNLSIDLTPKEYALSYLKGAFPTVTMVDVKDEEGKIVRVEPLRDETGAPVHSQEALALRDALLERLACLPAVPSLLDAVITAFGADEVAEITGGSRRIVTRNGRRVLETRPATSARTEAALFMEGRKRVLIFSDAGGTGRSYHAALTARNQQQRVHFAAEFGWRADNALQGLGRSHRTNQACPPIFRPLTSGIEGEKRLTSTIARRLDTLGALTRGERRSASNGLFRPEDNLESSWARHALTIFYGRMVSGLCECMSFAEFEEKTALRLIDGEGALRPVKDLPPINIFLNRILALRIADQRSIFSEFTRLVRGVVDGAAARGLLDQGVADIVAERVEVLEEEVIRTDCATGAETRLVTFELKYPRRVLSADEALARTEPAARGFYINNKGAAAIVEAGHTLVEGSSVKPALRIYRPFRESSMSVPDFEETTWKSCGQDAWRAAWEASITEEATFRTERVTLATGLLLPIWRKIGNTHVSVRRIKAPDGRRWLGRRLEAAEIAKLRLELGLASSDGFASAPGELGRMVLTRGATAVLGGGLTLRRALVMGAWRLELVGAEGHREALKQLGARIEIINYSPRLFLPVGDDEVMARVLRHHPVIQVEDLSRAA